ncbi:hypothetical protein SO694_000970118 [Aureococcus anophagefferens]|uniref:Uncharacterized protein n=1 Tax=Aureococcus anophagefferens TaxID=44056 RepID=A0ABR1FSE3_AURAN
MDYGYAQNYGNFYYNPDGLISGSLPALNIDTNTLSDGFTWSEYLAAKTYTDGLYISGMSYDGHCVYKEQPDPSAAPTAVPIPAPTPRPTTAPVNLPPGETAKPSPKPSPMPTEYDTIVAVASAVVMNGLDPDDFNAKTDMKTAFRKTIASIIASDEICPAARRTTRRASASPWRRSCAAGEACSPSRRRSTSTCTRPTVEGSTGAVTAGDDILSDVTTALTTSVSDGSFASTLTTEAAATGGDASTGFASAAVDVTASTTAIAASTVAITVDTPLPSPDPTAAPPQLPPPILPGVHSPT